MAEVFDAFRAGYPFELDNFQVAACRALESGSGVLVAAPTGAGKTVVGEFAVALALAGGRKCFWTSPIKALSNQKFSDLAARHDPAQVGLLTGDNTINGEAPVVVMTTEVLRNMLYARSGTLRDLGFVVMDEVHYLADASRGAVWEEVIIHLPDSVTLVSLSATVSNAEEFGEWLQTVRGRTEVVVSEHRPVPLWQHLLIKDQIVDLFADDGGDRPRLNPEIGQLTRGEAWSESPTYRRGGRGAPRGPRPPRAVPRRPDVIARLDRAGLLPAITFIFSRAGCDAAVEQCLRSGLRLNSDKERLAVRELAEKATANIPESDRVVLGYSGWLDGLERGIAAHHAGMLPGFREVVEALFVRGLVKAVFATETLAMGINMPARAVVLEKLVKFNGETHADITPGEFTQLTGRAGRRGIDVEGHAVVLWHPGMDPRDVAGLASSRTFPLRSSFQPSYNMAVNLVGQLGRERSRDILETSFAQFQADRSVVGLAAQIRKQDERLGEQAAAVCDRGDFTEYFAMRAGLSERENALAKQRNRDSRAQVGSSLRQLVPGDVITVPRGRFAGVAVVLDVDASTHDLKLMVMTADRQYRRLGEADFNGPVEPQMRIRIPKHFNPRNPHARRDLASTLRVKGAEPKRLRKGAGAGDDDEVARLRAAIRAHPCHSCPDREEHAREAERHRRLAGDTDKLRAQVAARTATVARTFDRVCGVLEDLEYLHEDSVTPQGRKLARIYGELDLLAAECLRRGVWGGLGPAELAACVSVLVYESRSQDDRVPPRLPDGAMRDALEATVRLWGELERLEKQHQLSFLREPDLGFVRAAHRWAQGKPLEQVLREAGLTAGDFVRWCKQLIDLLGQMADVADDEVRSVAEAAIGAVRRGVVAWSSLA